MSINISPPNFSNVQSSVGSPNLTNPGALGLQAYQVKVAQAEARRKAALEQMQLMQQGQLGMGQQSLERERMGLLANQQQQEMAMKQQQMGLLSQQNQDEMELKKYGIDSQAGQFQDELGFKQANLAQQGQMHQDEMGIKKDSLDAELQKMGLKQLLEDKKEKIQEKGAFASYARLSLENAKSPEEANQITNEFIKEAMEKEYISKDEAKQFTQLPISQRKSYLEAQIINTKLASQFKSMMDANKTNNSDVSLNVNSDGSIQYNKSPTKAVETESMKDVKSKDLALTQLKKVEDGYDPDYFTYKGQADTSLSKFAQKSKNTPGLEQVSEYLAGGMTGKSKDERAKFIEKRSSYMNNVDQLFNSYKKEITGAAAGKDEMEQIRKSFLNGDMSPSEFTGSLKQVVDKYKTESNYNKDILNKGMNTTPSGNSLRDKLKAAGHSDDEINSFFEKKGIKE